jgi:threonylcarbamoyladenosine tRNA methylthiotransferase CDKAL1
MQDIEDLNPQQAPDIRHSEGKVVRKSFKNKNDSELNNADIANSHLLPGKGSVYVKTWGCGHNNSDG